MGESVHYTSAIAVCRPTGKDLAPRNEGWHKRPNAARYRSLADIPRTKMGTSLTRGAICCNG